LAQRDQPVGGICGVRAVAERTLGELGDLGRRAHVIHGALRKQRQQRALRAVGSGQVGERAQPRGVALGLLGQVGAQRRQACLEQDRRRLAGGLRRPCVQRRAQLLDRDRRAVEGERRRRETGEPLGALGRRPRGARRGLQLRAGSIEVACAQQCGSQLGGDRVVAGRLLEGAAQVAHGSRRVALGEQLRQAHRAGRVVLHRGGA